MAHGSMSRRNFLNLAAGAGAGVALASCGSSGPSQGGGGAEASYWFLTAAPGEVIRKNAVSRFNKANPDNQIKPTAFENDAYKTKIRTALGAGQAPTIIWGWGGGGLKSWVEAGQVDDLTDWFAQNAAVKDRLFPSSFGAATVNGKIYAMPCETVEPIVLFYDKRAFDKIGAEPPQSWGDIMDLVPKFNAKGIAPFSLAGQSRWTNMMWLEFLFDRIGGPEVFQAVFDGQKDAWSHPAALDALGKVQELVRADGFVKGFSSVVADANADQALLFTGKAAMMVHGTWTYGQMAEEGGNFVSGGNLGYMNFPPVDGGKGDPSNTVGNPAQYLAISTKSSAEQKETAKKFFTTGVLTDEESAEWLDTGGVPIVKGSESKIASSKDPAFLKFVYDTASNAKVFAQSWDQALSPTAAEKLLDNIAKLFQLSITPQQYVDNMNQVIGQ
ncbi:extracellular solute-binding protein [Phytohabitans rumicis]|uniref:Sugar ABC transporter substrate-binding protein n=1 Tax=Phytohabitans rumicis TaxID=1076125 RepID=A0A6V8LMY6_9ACTN|nr:extracellular solute-binding protein [Phytohabitans rumicis]GFJ94035.1 sugar ABC transporter substrate-binding protein [Phytohabitans rumicis]